MINRVFVLFFLELSHSFSILGHVQHAGDIADSAVMRLFSHLAMACLCRGREVKKSGGGGRNWGNDASAGMDSANANADANDAEGGGWGANGAGAAAPSNEVCTHVCFFCFVIFLWIKVLHHFLVACLALVLFDQA